MNITEVTEKVFSFGVVVTSRTIQNYLSWGLIPPVEKEWLGRGGGSIVHYDDDTPFQALAAWHVLGRRTATTDDIKKYREYGLRLYQFDLFGMDFPEEEKVLISDDNFHDYFAKLKQHVFTDISSYEILHFFEGAYFWGSCYRLYKMIDAGEFNQEKISSPVIMKMMKLPVIKTVMRAAGQVFTDVYWNDRNKPIEIDSGSSPKK